MHNHECSTMMIDSCVTHGVCDIPQGREAPKGLAELWCAVSVPEKIFVNVVIYICTYMRWLMQYSILACFPKPYRRLPEYCQLRPQTPISFHQPTNSVQPLEISLEVLQYYRTAINISNPFVSPRHWCGGFGMAERAFERPSVSSRQQDTLNLTSISNENIFGDEFALEPSDNASPSASPEDGTSLNRLPSPSEADQASTYTHEIPPGDRNSSEIAEPLPRPRNSRSLNYNTRSIDRKSVV